MSYMLQYSLSINRRREGNFINGKLQIYGMESMHLKSVMEMGRNPIFFHFFLQLCFGFCFVCLRTISALVSREVLFPYPLFHRHHAIRSFNTCKKKTVRTKNRMVIYELAQFERNSYNSFTNRGRKKSKLLTAFTAAELLEWKIIRFRLQFQWDCIIDIAFVVCIRPTAWWLYCGIRVLENISIVYISILMVLFMACEATLARYNSVRM